jgi:hypothetical protein
MFWRLESDARVSQAHRAKLAQPSRKLLTCRRKSSASAVRGKYGGLWKRGASSRWKPVVSKIFSTSVFLLPRLRDAPELLDMEMGTSNTWRSRGR